MKIAAFYENILEGINQKRTEQKITDKEISKNEVTEKEITEKEVLISLVDQGLQRVYMDFRLLAADEIRLIALFSEVGLEVEGLYGFYEFGKNPTDESYKEHIDLAARVHADNVLIVPGFFDNGEEEQQKHSLENMRIALNHVVKYGKTKGITVTLEDFDSINSPLNCVDGLQWFMDRVEDLRCTFDTGNFIIRGEDVFEAFKQFETKISGIHLKDRSYSPIHEKDQPFILPDGGCIYPAPVGSGYIPMKKIIDRLTATRYNKTVIIELFGYHDMLSGIKESIAWLKKTGAQHRTMELEGFEYRAIVENSPNMIWRAGLDTKCNYFNETWLNFTGRRLEDEMGDGWAEGVHPDDFNDCVRTYLKSFENRESFEMEYRLMRKDGVYRWINDRGVPFYDLEGVFEGYIGSCFDVTDKVEGKKLKEMAHIDRLTGLHNRNYLENILEFEFDKAYHSNLDFIVLIMDIDKFKSINDQYGHRVGDVVLQEVAKCITKVVGDEGVFGRFGGDEFIVIYTDVQLSRAEYLAVKIIESLAKINIRDLPIEVGASIGLCQRIEHSTVLEVIEHADKAMYKAKQSTIDKICKS